jgi:hypothetical protein
MPRLKAPDLTSHQDSPDLARHPAWAAGQKTKLYNRDINWFINCAAASLGARSNLGGVVAAIERGGGGSGVPETDIYSNWQIGWCAGLGAVERWRKLSQIWKRLELKHQEALAAHYAGTSGDLAPNMWARLNGEFGIVALAVLWLNPPEVVGKVVEAVSFTRANPADKQRRSVVDAAKRRALQRVQSAHSAWERAERGAAAEEPAPTAKRGWREEYAELKERVKRRREAEAVDAGWNEGEAAE